MKKMNLRTFVLLLLILGSITTAYALTASIGNAKMILNYTLEKNKDNILEKSILVKNPNDIPVLIQLKTEGDLDGITTILENNLTLQANQEKDVVFSVKLSEPGELNGRINVFFSDPEGKQAGLVLSSTIQIYVLGEGTIVEPQNQTRVNQTRTNGNGDNATDKSPVSVSVGGSGNVLKEGEKSEFNMFFIAFIALAAIIVLAIIIIIMKRS